MSNDSYSREVARRARFYLASPGNQELARRLTPKSLADCCFLLAMGDLSKTTIASSDAVKLVKVLGGLSHPTLAQLNATLDCVGPQLTEPAARAQVMHVHATVRALHQLQVVYSTTPKKVP